MADNYIYDPRTLNPVVAGVAAGSVGAIAASLISLPVTSPNDTVANPLTVTVVAMIIGALSGFVWRSVRATSNGARTFVIAMVAGLFVVLSAFAIIEWTAGGGWFTYSALVAIVVFLSIGLLTPAISRAVAPVWAAMIPVVLAFVVAVGLFAG
ncbi:MAG: hypothetical protein U9R47_09320 [Actinomycetota bacterium]|nr:hypothetical protein [Actinomycetota bacterium]